ncbi:hypothetical protein [Pelagibius sp.]|uniref:hypothetical protein n=1 Tax=Pelagibius sp. TaxID=1931238 RepID=UPI002620B1DB|nr:hypothetical protein [Pelagibius sp.]
MSNHMMFWRSAGLDQVICKNRSQARQRARDQEHLPCSQHSAAELAAFERSLRKPVTALRVVKH